MNQEALNLLLNYIHAYGAPALGVFVFIVALGIPLPGSMSLVAAGMIASQGRLEVWLTVLLAFVGAALGDSLGFTIGQVASLERRQRWNRNSIWRRVVETFHQYGYWSVALVRTLLTSVTLPFNLFYAVSGMPYWRFLLLDLGGVLAWVVVYFGLGYLLGIGLLKGGEQLNLLLVLLPGMFLLGLAFYVWQRRRHGF